jgi:hypothetical protein
MMNLYPLRRAICAAVAMTAIVIGPVVLQEGNAVKRQPEKQNELVDFEETPEAPEPPDIGIAVRVWPAQVEPGKPVFLAGSYSADCALLAQCQQHLAACVILTLVRIDGDKLFKVSLPLVTPTVKITPPPLGDYDPYYREEEQFKLDLITFFDLPKKGAAYTIEATLGSYSSGQHTFRVGKPLR